jgi:hypothetical protein
VLNHIKIIAEPWDLGTYQVGNFPIDWSEWNGKFRDTVRRFGKRGPDRPGELLPCSPEEHGGAAGEVNCSRRSIPAPGANGMLSPVKVL